jgi:flagellar basal-body rod modification protein FlgD
MPGIGRPQTFQKNKFRDVQMAPESKKNLDNKLIDKLTGSNRDSGMYVDGKEHNKMGKEGFLKLLTFQLQNQDPMKPMENGKISGELAQFSQLEQLSNLNKKFDALNKNAGVEDKFYGASFLGKEVVTSGSSINYEGKGKDADILFSLEKPAEKVLVKVLDSKNNIVNEIWKENLGRGNQTITWDGKSMDGGDEIAGQFSVMITAWDEQAQKIPVDMKVKGTVQSIFFENGETVLQVDGKKVFLRDVDSFHNGEASAAKKAIAQKLQNAVGQKLPTAQNKINELQLKKNQSMNAYNNNQQEVGTGITNVYDVE